MGGERQAIVIIGAGIGGLAAALALAAVGYHIVVVERSDHLNEAGAGIQIAPNAGRILARLGLEKAIAASAIEPEAIEIRSGSSGNLITAIPCAEFRARYGFPYHVIHRADLQNILASAAAAHPDIDLELGATVPQYMTHGDGFLVRIQKPTGIDVVPAVALIAADGVWSTFREKIAGSAQPEPTGRTAWRAVVPADTARDLVAMNRTGLWLGPDAHLVHYPVTQGTAVNIVAIVDELWEKKAWHTPEEQTKIADRFEAWPRHKRKLLDTPLSAEKWANRGWNAAGHPTEIANRFREWPAAARNLIAAPIAWQKFGLFTIDPSGPWTDGRLALLGDAAHAMRPFLAQGAAMAIEDAAVLADALHNTSDVPAALRAYETARKPRVQKVAEASSHTGEQYHYAGLTALARNTALRVAGPRLILERNDWIYRWEPPQARASDRPLSA